MLKHINNHEDETILFSKRPDISVVVAVGLLWMIFILGTLRWTSNILDVHPIISYSVAIGVLTTLLIHFWLVASQSRYLITNKRVIIENGGIVARSMYIEYDNIDKITSEKGVCEWLMGSGRIVATAKSGERIVFSGAGLESSFLEAVKQTSNVEVVDRSSVEPQYKGVTWY